MKAILPFAISTLALGTAFSCSWKPETTCSYHDMVPGHIVPGVYEAIEAY